MIYTWSLGHHFCGLAVSHYTAYSCSLFLCLSQSLAVSPCISVILCLFLSSYYSMSSCFCVFLISPSASSCLFVLSVILCLPTCLFLCLSDSVFFSLLMATNYCSGMVDQRKNFKVLFPARTFITGSWHRPEILVQVLLNEVVE